MIPNQGTPIKEGAAKFCTDHGVTMVEVIRVSRQSRQTLQNWHKHKPNLFCVVVWGVAGLLDSGGDGESD